MNRNDIAVVYGNDVPSMMQQLLAHVRPETWIPRDAAIGIKPNLVVSKPSSSGATTDPAIVEAIICHLQKNGFSRITILESAWIGDDTEEAFRVCGYEEVAKKTGVSLLDLKRDGSVAVPTGDHSVRVCRAALDLDFLINVPVLKAHCQTRLTCALKNLKGCIPDGEKRRFHAEGLHPLIAALNKALRTDLIVVDGIVGDLSFEEGGTPVHMDRIFAGVDPVLVDSYGASLLGYQPTEIPYIPMAESLGIGSTNLKDAVVHPLNRPPDAVDKFEIPRDAMDLAKYIHADGACSACHGSLIHALKRLSDRGQLSSLKEKIHIGQGLKHRNINGIGIGTCTSGLSSHLEGCPPEARSIVDYLSEKIG